MVEVAGGSKISLAIGEPARDAMDGSASMAASITEKNTIDAIQARREREGDRREKGI